MFQLETLMFIMLAWEISPLPGKQTNPISTFILLGVTSRLMFFTSNA